MDIGSIFLILALLITVVIFISQPLMERRMQPTGRSENGLSSLLAKRDQVIASIQELDEDYRLGKIPAESYPTQRVSLVEEGVAILQQIDGYHTTVSGITAGEPSSTALNPGSVSPKTAAQVNKNALAVPPVPDDELEQRIAAHRRTMHEKAGGFCPKCGKPVQVSDRFCPKCGATLA
jgi:hypothetical protein